MKRGMSFVLGSGEYNVCTMLLQMTEVHFPSKTVPRVRQTTQVCSTINIAKDGIPFKILSVFAL